MRHKSSDLDRVWTVFEFSPLRRGPKNRMCPWVDLRFKISPTTDVFLVYGSLKPTSRDLKRISTQSSQSQSKLLLVGVRNFCTYTKTVLNLNLCTKYFRLLMCRVDLYIDLSKGLLRTPYKCFIYCKLTDNMWW